MSISLCVLGLHFFLPLIKDYICHNSQISHNIAYSAFGWSIGEHQFETIGHQASFCQR